MNSGVQQEQTERTEKNSEELSFLCYVLFETLRIFAFEQ